MEKLILQRICRKAKIIRLNRNGEDVFIDLVANSLLSILKILEGDYDFVIAVIDRESRALSANEMAKQVLAFVSPGLKGLRFEVVVVDRCIENWILADTTLIKHNLTTTEGVKGKAKLKSILRSQKRTYHETTDGVDLFCKINPLVVAKNSPSFLRFKQLVQKDCTWITRFD
jgi:hypothetical protein